MPEFNKCPRCQGRLFGNSDVYGEYMECLQCGHVIYIESARLDFVVVRGRQKPGRPKKRDRRTAA